MARAFCSRSSASRRARSVTSRTMTTIPATPREGSPRGIKDRLSACSWPARSTLRATPRWAGVPRSAASIASRARGRPRAGSTASAGRPTTTSTDWPSIRHSVGLALVTRSRGLTVRMPIGLSPESADPSMAAGGGWSVSKDCSISSAAASASTVACRRSSSVKASGRGWVSSIAPITSSPVRKGTPRKARTGGSASQSARRPRARGSSVTSVLTCERPVSTTRPTSPSPGATRWPMASGGRLQPAASRRSPCSASRK